MVDELLLRILVASASLAREDHLLAVGKETFRAYLRRVAGQKLRRFGPGLAG